MPVIEDALGNKYHWENGKLHREDGPAVELSNHRKEWWLENKQYSENAFNILIQSNKLQSIGVTAIVNKDGHVVWSSETFINDDGEVSFKPSRVGPDGRATGWVSFKLAIQKMLETKDKNELDRLIKLP
jgi:hypothetical protein